MKLNKMKYLLPALLFALPACMEEDEALVQNILAPIFVWNLLNLFLTFLKKPPFKVGQSPSKILTLLTVITSFSGKRRVSIL